ncbi:unnamed protein product [Citrullus colocynthis]|uniref:Uncharacterized protein n=1 Tax=Citrullus colocynthis TaxID=252529 RepID=A0ABP0Z6I6_9ROSI
MSYCQRETKDEIIFIFHICSPSPLQDFFYTLASSSLFLFISLSLSPPFRFSLPFYVLSATARRLKLTTEPNKQTKTLFAIPNNPKPHFLSFPIPFPLSPPPLSFFTL